MKESRSGADYLEEVYDALSAVWDKSKFNLKKGYDDEYDCECVVITLREDPKFISKTYVIEPGDANFVAGRPTAFQTVWHFPGDHGVGVGETLEFQSTDLDDFAVEAFDYFDELKQRAAKSFESKKGTEMKSEANKEDLKNKVVSDGTLNSKELVIKFLDVLEEYDNETYLSYMDGNPELVEDWDNIDEETFGMVLDDLFDLLNGIAPEGYYFGASEGDGACFGFWSAEQDESKKKGAKSKKEDFNPSAEFYLAKGAIEDWLDRNKVVSYDYDGATVDTYHGAQPKGDWTVTWDAADGEHTAVVHAGSFETKFNSFNDRIDLSLVKDGGKPMWYTSASDVLYALEEYINATLKGKTEAKKAEATDVQVSRAQALLDSMDPDQSFSYYDEFDDDIEGVPQTTVLFEAPTAGDKMLTFGVQFLDNKLVSVYVCDDDGEWLDEGTDIDDIKKDPEAWYNSVMSKVSEAKQSERFIADKWYVVGSYKDGTPFFVKDPKKYSRTGKNYDPNKAKAYHTTTDADDFDIVFPELVYSKLLARDIQKGIMPVDDNNADLSTIVSAYMDEQGNIVDVKGNVVVASSRSEAKKSNGKSSNASDNKEAKRCEKLQSVKVSADDVGDAIGDKELVQKFVALFEDGFMPDSLESIDPRIDLGDYLMGWLPTDDDDDDDDRDDDGDPRQMSDWKELKELWDAISSAYRKAKPDCAPLECSWEEDSQDGHVVFSYDANVPESKQTEGTDDVDNKDGKGCDGSDEKCVSERAIPGGKAFLQKMSDAGLQDVLDKMFSKGITFELTNTDGPIYAPGYARWNGYEDKRFVGNLYHCMRSQKSGDWEGPIFLGWDKKLDIPYVYASGAKIEGMHGSRNPFEEFMGMLDTDLSESLKNEDSIADMEIQVRKPGEPWCRWTVTWPEYVKMHKQDAIDRGYPEVRVLKLKPNSNIGVVVDGPEESKQTERRLNPVSVDAITKDDFDAYVAVQRSGKYNMIMDADAAADAADLDIDTYYGIIKNYGALVSKYGRKGESLSESLTLKQKELKDMARFGQAEDITTISDEEAKALRKKGIETIGVSRGTYGMNGALLRDNEGKKYVITSRSSNLFYFV